MTPIPLRQNTKHLQSKKIASGDFSDPKMMLDSDAFFGQRAIRLFLLFGQRLFLTFLKRCPCSTNTRQTLIATVRYRLGTRVPMNTTATKQRVIMVSAFAEKSTQNLIGVGIADNLRLQRVALLFTAIEPLLFFWGRWMGVSVASKRILAGGNERSDFLPGK